MGFRQIFGGCRPPKYFTDGVPSNVWGVYSHQIFHGWGSVEYLGGLHPQNTSRMGFRQILGGCTLPIYFTDGVPSNIWGLYTPKIFDGWGSVKHLGGLHPQNIRRMGFRQIFGGCRPPKYFTDGVPSNFWGVYSPQIVHGWGSVKYLGGLQPPNISRNHIREIFWGSAPPKYFTDGVPSNIWGLYTPKIFHGWGSVKYLGGLQPPNISRNHIREIYFWGLHPEIFHGWGSVKYLGAVHPQNI